MSPATSLYLDTARFLAALVVFLGHASSGKWTGGLLWQVAPLGARAVDIFFVISGFVIAYVVDTKETRPSIYLVSRMARLYSVVIPALFITLIFDAIGKSISYAPYVSSNCEYNQIFAFFANAIFVNEIWNNHIVFGSNGPYWSLGFEVIYYIIFGIAIFVPKRCSVILTAIAIIIAGPKIMVLFPLWLLGVFCYKLTRKKIFGMVSGALIFIISSVMMAYYMAYFADNSTHGYDPLDQLTNIPSRYIDNYVTAALFSINILAFDAIAAKIYPFLSYFRRPIRWISGATFSLYLFHLPTVELMVALSP